MTKITKIILPAQQVEVDTPEGVDPVWYEKLQQVAGFVTLFSEIDPAQMTTGQTFRWNATTKKFSAGA
jgi:hypothetical protein